MQKRIQLCAHTGMLLLLMGVGIDCSKAAVQLYPFHGYAIVYEDATLKVSGKSVRLYGIYIPPTGRDCRSTIRPARCATRAALALDFKIQGFVHCEPQWKNRDGSLTSVCRVGRTHTKTGEDLSAYLLTQGWALAAPYAPFEYHALERIAESRGLGVWGFPADLIQRR